MSCFFSKYMRKSFFKKGLVMKRMSIASFVFCLSCQSWAAASLTVPNNTLVPRFYISVGAGEMLNQSSGDNYLGTGAGWPDDHYVRNTITNEPVGFIEIGAAWQRPEAIFPGVSLGLRYMSAAAAKVSGYIDQYSLPDFRNYDFSYQVQLSNLMALLKAGVCRVGIAMPYILAGAGAGIYSTSNYTEQATPNVTPRVSPAFASVSNTQFSYQFGAGIDFAILKTLSLNFEYDHIHYGTVQTGNGVNYATETGTNYDNESLRNKINANTLFLSLTYYPE